MDEVKTPTPTEQFVKTMTHQMFSDFYHAMQARLHMDEPLNRYLNPKASLSADEVLFVRQREKIKAIKAVRQRTGLGLKEAKDLVDDWCQQNGVV